MMIHRIFSPRWMIAIFTVLVVIFLMVPIVVVATMSFSAFPASLFPPQEWTTQWYAEVLTSRAFRASLVYSLVIACIATAGALFLGTTAALALVKLELPGARFIEGLLMSPLIFPGLVIGLMLLKVYSSMGMFNPMLNLALAHILITLPYVTRNVTASLRQIDPALEEAAETLGAGKWMIFRRVIVPQISGGLIAGGIFAFIMSFDNFVVSLWLSDAGAVPLPILIFQNISSSFTPSVSAEATIMVGFGIVAVIVLELCVGLKKSLSH